MSRDASMLLPNAMNSGVNSSTAATTTCVEYYNVTVGGNSTNITVNPQGEMLGIVLTWLCAVCYIIILSLGWLGNGLVIYVVLRYAKMKTVTNMYILNLAISDVLFIVSLPFLTTTTIVKHWVFGFAMCKIYFVLFSINLFTGVFTLAVMSADRYLAVCHPIRSLKYRTPRIALFLCLCIWSVSFLVMLPVILYSTTVGHRTGSSKYTCSIQWPDGQPIPSDKAFIWYSFILGFAVPVSLIAVFYMLVVLRLRQVGPNKKSKEKKKSHRRVTRLVLSVITVYVSCWLPYWIFQVDITFRTEESEQLVKWKIVLFNVFTVMTFANSMFNPLLYAFLSDNFRKSFKKAFKCASPRDVNKSLCNENSVFPKNSTAYNRSCAATATTEERMELSTFDNGNGASQMTQATTVGNLADVTNSSDIIHAPLSETNSLRSVQDEEGYLKPPVAL
ncbi:somatostatin receptor type 2-like [Littorina saxatilis]|uniref:G-protein coupled receptors family 1 profile domain-containing protein n=1 Tax=Littorina saxatilis TaxID=31220 RepID=A0AAN9GMR1_9CAEN